ncbi:tetratricopeptide repeat protein [Streptomyces sp. NPDC032472]|uniref:tetratricopeptide repeat protein n=1 Tax=Streptomyces sp. NPDC032472 TaxID=3155018 RepID=UPI0033E33DEA
MHNLAVARAETGDPQGALTDFTEAVDLYRALAQDNPAAQLPNLARAQRNLATALADTGDARAALTALSEAVDLYRSLARQDPAAHLLGLAGALGDLARTAGVREALAAYAEAERALAAHPESARFLAVLRAELEVNAGDAEAGLRVLVSLSGGREPDRAALRARQLLRARSRSGDGHAAEVAALWREAAGAAPPAWLFLPPAAFDLASAWLACPSWAASRAFWDEHGADLGLPETLSALEELTLVGGRYTEEHLRIAREVEAVGPDEAFRPYLTGELLDAWMILPTWEESRIHLAEHAAVLLHDQALGLLGSELDTAASAVHFALLSVARAEGIPAAYRYLEDRAAVDERLHRLMEAPEVDPELLYALGLLELHIHEDEFTSTAHLALANALDGEPVAAQAEPTHWPPATPAARTRIVGEIAALIGRRPARAPALGALIQEILAVAETETG